MGILLGWLAAVCFLFLIAKVFTRKFKFDKANAFLKKLHIPLFLALIILCIGHVYFVMPAMKTRTHLLHISGAAIILCVLLLLILCPFMKKNKKVWMICHRVLSVVTLICILWHIVVSLVVL